MFGEHTLAIARGVRRAALHGKVLAADHHGALVDLSRAYQVVGRVELFHLALFVQVGTTGDTAATDAGVLEENMRRFDAMPLAIQALLNQDVDVVVMDSAPAEKALAGADGVGGVGTGALNTDEATCAAAA